MLLLCESKCRRDGTELAYFCWEVTEPSAELAPQVAAIGSVTETNSLCVIYLANKGDYSKIIKKLKFLI